MVNGSGSSVANEVMRLLALAGQEGWVLHPEDFEHEVVNSDRDLDCVVAELDPLWPARLPGWPAYRPDNQHERCADAELSA